MTSDTMPSEYASLVQLFIELRGKGMSLSSDDLEVVRQWKLDNVDAEAVARVMLDFAADQRERAAAFPTTLKPVARRVTKLRKQQAEF